MRFLKHLPLAALAITVNLLFGRAGFGQITDWRAHFRESASTDSAVRDEARTRLAKTLLPRLEAADPISLDKGIAAMLQTFNDTSEEVRLQASALIGALALTRRDGTEALKRAVPLLLSQFNDRNP